MMEASMETPRDENRFVDYTARNALCIKKIR